MVDQDLFIGIDLGTSGCRAMAINRQKQIIAEARSTMAAPEPDPAHPDSSAQQDPQIWWQAVQDTLKLLLQQIPDADIKALAVDGTSGTLLICDNHGNPLGPALMYNDGRSTSEAALIEEKAPKECAAHGATSALAKLLHLKPGPEARYALHQADWIIGKLSGRWGISDANNCLKLGYDPIKQEWPPWLKALLIEQNIAPQLLPAVVRPGTPLGLLKRLLKDSHLFHRLQDTQLIAGTTDSTAAFIATGADETGEAVTSLGSTLVMKVIADKPIFSPEHGVYAQPLAIGDQSGKWLVGGGSNSGGAVLLHHFSKKQMDEMTPKLRPNEETGLNYYPLVNPGERFPVCDAALPPKIEPRPSNNVRFFQAMLEGMADIEQRGYELLAELGAPYPISVRSAGGGSRNEAWADIRQKRIHAPLIEAEQQEAAYGSALLAFQGYEK